MAPLRSLVCLLILYFSTAQETTVVPGCYIRQADIVFLLDSSNSEGAANFEKQKDFVSTFANSLVIGPDDIQISVVTYESNIHNQFNLDTYENKTDLVDAIRNISFIAGNTLTEKALNFVRTVSFTNSSGDRENVDNILVLLTDGHSTDRNSTLDEAEMLHNTSTKVITIGIGADVDASELTAIASDPSDAFTVPNFDALSGIQNSISAQACVIIVTTTTPEPTTPTTTEPPCNVSQADIVFLLDTSNSLGQVNFDRQKQFVLDVVNALDIGPDDTQVAITTFQTVIQNIFQLNTYANKIDMLNTIRQIQFSPGNTFTDKALKYARQVMFQPENGDRADVRDVLILMTDGQSSDQIETSIEAEKIHNQTEIDVITIGVGNKINSTELLAIASTPSYYLSVDDYSELNSIIAKVGFQTTGCNITLPSTTSTSTTEATTTITTTPAPLDLDCNRTVADILFLVDSSENVSRVQFQQEKDFISEITKEFTISPKDVQVAFATFSAEVHSSFLLNDHYNISNVLEEISNTIYSPGTSMPSLGLTFAESVFQTGNGDRDNATDIIFLISAGETADGLASSTEAQTLKDGNITIVTFALSNSTELQNIASPTFAIQDINTTTAGLPANIKAMIDQISGLIPCPTTTPATTSTPSTTTLPTTPTTIPTTTTMPTTTVTDACSKTVADVLFLVDSSNSLSKDDFETEKNFTSQVIQQFTISPDDVQVAYLTFESDIHPQFQFNTFNNSIDVLEAVQSTNFTPGNTFADRALEYARETIFKPENGDRPNVTDIIILMSDGQSTFPALTSTQADLLKAENVTIVTFAISTNTEGLAELQDIASPSYAVNTSFPGLISKVNGLVDTISSLSFCPTAAPTTPTPCYAPEADIVFLMDSSNSLGPDNWEKEKDFVKSLIGSLDVGTNDMQVGVVTFESNPAIQFYLNEYDNKDDAMSAVNNISFHTGNTMTGKALEFIRQSVFVSEAGDRPNANNILVILTDGKSSDSAETLEQAALLKNDSVKIFAIGVGLTDDGKDELEAIATDQNHAFEASNFFTLSSLQSEIELTKVDCLNTTLPPVTTTPTTTPTTTSVPDCDQRRADIIFVLDSSNSEGLENFRKQLDFVKNFVELVEIGPTYVQVGVVTFESEEHNEFDLNEYLNKDDLVNAIESITYKPGNTFTGKALALVNQHSLTAAAGNRPSANDIVIVMTDGQSTDQNETLVEAASLKSSYPDLDVFAIGIGASVNNEELSAIATSSENIYHAPNFQFISEILPLLGNSTCLPPPTENDCESKEANVVFLLDSSTTEGSENFKKQLNFVNLFANKVNIDVNHVLVSVITFSSNPINRFYMNAYTNRYALTQALMSIPYVGGNTFTDLALKLARENSFLPSNGARPDTENVIVLLTDGRSTDSNSTINEAELVHNSTDNITVYTIGIGSAIDASELEMIATDENTTFYVEDFSSLSGLIDAFGNKFCNVTTSTTLEPAPTTSTENPRTTAPITAPTIPSLPIPCAYKKVDMIFLMDTSNSEGPSNFAIQKNFVYNVAQNFDIGQDAVRVGVVTFASNVFNQFNLSTYDSRSEVLQAISKVAFTPGNTITEAALKYVREESFTPEAGDRPDVGNVLVVLTDGQSTDANETIEEAAALHNTSTKVISIGIGAGVDASEITQIASNPNLAYTVADFNALKGIQIEVEKSACVDAVVCEDNADCESMGKAICMRFDGWARRNCAKYCEYCKLPQ